MKLFSIAGLKDHTNRLFSFSLTATLVGFLVSRSLKWTGDCLRRLLTENRRHLSKFCSQSTVTTMPCIECESLNVTWQGKATLEVSTAAPAGHNCASRLYSLDVWWLEMFCCRQYIKHFDPGMILPGCGHVVPCYPVRNKQLPMRHFSIILKTSANKKGECHRRHTGGTSVPQSDKIKAFFSVHFLQFGWGLPPNKERILLHCCLFQ